MHKSFSRKPAIIFFVFLAICSVCSAEPSEAPDFKLPDTAGKTITLSNYKNKQQVLILFWTTWCPYCRRELKLLNDMSAQLEKEGTQILAVNVEEPGYKVSNFIKNYGLGFKVLLDRDGSVASSYGILGVPTYVLIDKKGNKRFQENFLPLEEYKKLIAQ